MNSHVSPRLFFIFVFNSLLVVAPVVAQPAKPEVTKEDVKRMERLAESGNARAMFNLGVYFENGRGGLPVNYTQALYWYEKAALAGDLGAQYNLGLMHAHGRGTPKNPKEALYWFKRAAEAGDAQSQYNLAVMYDQGHAGDRGRLEATHWFKEAAERGHAKSQYTLAVMYLNGQGVTRDPVEGYKWMSLAADQGLAEAVIDQRELWKKLAESEVRAGQSRVAHFKVKTGPVADPVNRRR